MLSHMFPHRAWELEIGATQRMPSSGSDWDKPNKSNENQQPIENWRKLDLISRILFPVLFFIFTSIYVPVLLIGSHNETLNFLGTEDFE